MAGRISSPGRQKSTFGSMRFTWWHQVEIEKIGLQYYLTPPKFNSSPLKMHGWKTILLWDSVTFQGRLLLNFRWVRDGSIYFEIGFTYLEINNFCAVFLEMFVTFSFSHLTTFRSNASRTTCKCFGWAMLWYVEIRLSKSGFFCISISSVLFGHHFFPNKK